MVMLIETGEHYRLDDITDHRAFLRSLKHILDKGDVLVFSTYGSSGLVQEFFEHKQLPPDEMVLRERQRLALYFDEHPNASAYLVPFSHEWMEQLATRCDDDPSNLCDHVYARGRRGGIFTFHDAFKSDPLFLSSRVDQERVISFSAELGKKWFIEQNPFV